MRWLKRAAAVAVRLSRSVSPSTMRIAASAHSIRAAMQLQVNHPSPAPRIGHLQTPATTGIGSSFRMRRWLILTLLFTGPALAISSASADDADDLAEVARLQARLHSEVPTNLRVFAAAFESGATLLLRAPGTASQQASIRSGTGWVELKPSGYSGNSCPDSGIPIAEFSLESGMRAFFKARAIAHEQLAATITPDDIGFSYEGDHCEPGWRITLVTNDMRYLYLTFGVDASLARVSRWEDGDENVLDAASVRSMDALASVALPIARAEAESLPVEAEIVAPSGDEYLVASFAGQAYVCENDDIHFVYDYYSIDLRCEGDSTHDPLVVTVAGVEPGASEHRMVAGMPGPALWTRRGLVDLESDDKLGDTRVWIDAFDARLIEGRFEGTVTNASGKRVKIADGRFRLLPGEGFRVTPP
jgi:hypothetical protein